jgi:4-amino-4-deoxy-L-arabinose transferase-like glycosyltransferase
MTKNGGKTVCLTWIGVLALAAALRIGWLILTPVAPVSDSSRYDFFAQRIATGHGYSTEHGPTAYWPVGPSFLYSLVYRAVGAESDSRFLAAAILSFLVGMGTVWLTMLVGQRCFGETAGVFSGLLMAIWPSQIQFTTVIASEPPMLFFMMAAIASWTTDKWSVWLRGGFTGALLACASYMRPTCLLIPVVLLAASIFDRKRPMAALGGSVIAIVVMAALILPWTYRNYRVFSVAVPISTNGGANFWMGNNPGTAGAYMALPPPESFGDEVDRDKKLMAEAVAYIREDPLSFVGRTLVKAVRLHERESIGVVWNLKGLERRFSGLSEGNRDRLITAVKVVSNLYWWLMAAAGVVGAALLFRRPLEGQRRSYLPLLTWVYFTAVHAVTVYQDRYHFASIPMIAILAALVLRRFARPSGELGEVGA